MTAPSIGTQMEDAALPSALVVVKAAQAMVAGLSNDPITAAGQLPGAFTVFLGTIQMQLPNLAVAEFSVVKGDAATGLAKLAENIQAKITAGQTAAAAPTPTPAGA